MCGCVVYPLRPFVSIKPFSLIQTMFEVRFSLFCGFRHFFMVIRFTFVVEGGMCFSHVRLVGWLADRLARKMNACISVDGWMCMTSGVWWSTFSYTNLLLCVAVCLYCFVVATAAVACLCTTIATH